MGSGSRHVSKWFSLTLILLNDREQLENGFRNSAHAQLAWVRVSFFFVMLSDNVSVTFLGSQKCPSSAHPARQCLVCSSLEVKRCQKCEGLQGSISLGMQELPRRSREGAGDVGLPWQPHPRAAGTVGNPPDTKPGTGWARSGI